MKVAIVYDSRTGTTQAAAHTVAEVFREAGHEVAIDSATVRSPWSGAGAGAGAALH